MESWDWATIIVGLLAFIGTVAVQLMIRSGEPKKLKTLRLLTEVIDKYDSTDEGLDALLEMRKALALSIVSTLTAPPWWRRVANGTVITIVAILVSAIITALVSYLVGQTADEAVMPPPTGGGTRGILLYLASTLLQFWPVLLPAAIVTVGLYIYWSNKRSD